MLKWAIICAIISLVAGVFGFTGLAAGAAASCVLMKNGRKRFGMCAISRSHHPRKKGIDANGNAN